ncbi:MAG: hypothetical protein PUE04_05025 [Lachnospira sp.]|nr:hypothetical protein [Lachnospira sp.]
MAVAESSHFMNQAICWINPLADAKRRARNSAEQPVQGLSAEFSSLFANRHSAKNLSNKILAELSSRFWDFYSAIFFSNKQLAELPASNRAFYSAIHPQIE